MKIGQTIKEYRLRRGFNQGDFSKKIGITQANLCRIEKNLNKPSEETLDKIGLELGLSKEFIMIKAADLSDREDVPEEIKSLFKSLVNLGEEVFFDDNKSSK